MNSLGVWQEMPSEKASTADSEGCASIDSKSSHSLSGSAWGRCQVIGSIRCPWKLTYSCSTPWTLQLLRMKRNRQDCSPAGPFRLQFWQNQGMMNASNCCKKVALPENGLYWYTVYWQRSIVCKVATLAHVTVLCEMMQDAFYSVQMLGISVKGGIAQNARC